MARIERVADVGFEAFYDEAVARKAKLREELEEAMEKEFAVKAEKFDAIIEATSHEVEVEDVEATEEKTEEVGE